MRKWIDRWMDGWADREIGEGISRMRHLMNNWLSIHFVLGSTVTLKLTRSLPSETHVAVNGWLAGGTISNYRREN